MIITISPMINNRTTTMISTISTMINSSSSTMISTGRLRELAHSGALCRLFPRVAGKEKHFKVLFFFGKNTKRNCNSNNSWEHAYHKTQCRLMPWYQSDSWMKAKVIHYATSESHCSTVHGLGWLLCNRNAFSQFFPIVWPNQGIPWESWRPEDSKNVVVFEFRRF